MREDWDFEKGTDGKGYHVNASLGTEKVAFCKKAAVRKRSIGTEPRCWESVIIMMDRRKRLSGFRGGGKRNTPITEPTMGCLISGPGEGTKDMQRPCFLNQFPLRIFKYFMIMTKDLYRAPKNALDDIRLL